MDNHKKDTVPLGGVVLGKDPIIFNQEKPETKLKVRNTGDRPIQVGSHYHFFEVNNALEFDRNAAFGKRLNIASTTAIRFEPGDELEISLIPIGGKQTVYGFNELVNDWAGIPSNKETYIQKNALQKSIKLGFKTNKHDENK